MTNKFENYTFTVRNVRGVELNEALRVWKTAYSSFDEFLKNVIIYESLEEFGDYVSTVWSDIKPLEISEAFEQNNTEKRRLYFDTIGVEKIFESVEPDLLDMKDVVLNNRRWDADGKEYLQTGLDRYTLYKIDGYKLFGSTISEWQRKNSSVYAVKCTCTSTGRNYWLYVPREVGEKESALEAIAWTCRIGITNPKAIYRQGDIFVVAANHDSKVCEPYHLDYATYSSLIQSQT
jgi:hypothetical protein